MKTPVYMRHAGIIIFFSISNISLKILTFYIHVWSFTYYFYIFRYIRQTNAVYSAVCLFVSLLLLHYCPQDHQTWHVLEFRNAVRLFCNKKKLKTEKVFYWLKLLHTTKKFRRQFLRPLTIKSTSVAWLSLLLLEAVFKYAPKSTTYFFLKFFLTTWWGSG
jgi:hypothetical protein